MTEDIRSTFHRADEYKTVRGMLESAKRHYARRESYLQLLEDDNMWADWSVSGCPCSNIPAAI